MQFMHSWLIALVTQVNMRQFENKLIKSSLISITDHLYYLNSRKNMRQYDNMFPVKFISGYWIDYWTINGLTPELTTQL